jgi:hypothetical protein
LVMVPSTIVFLVAATGVRRVPQNRASGNERPARTLPTTLLHDSYDSISRTAFCCCAFQEKCTHKMSEIPRWISSKKVEVVRTLLADDPVRTHSMRGCDHFVFDIYT